MVYSIYLLLPGQGKPSDPPGGAGGSSLGKGCLGNFAANVSQTHIGGKTLIIEWKKKKKIKITFNTFKFSCCNPPDIFILRSLLYWK